MSKVTISYPAIFKEDKEDPSWINVSFPDIWCGVTCGKGMEEALYMAKDLLKLMLETSPMQCEKPHSLEETQANFPDEIVKLVTVEANIDDDWRRL